MYDGLKGKEIERLYRLVKRAKTEETKNKHLAKIEILIKEIFGK